jgi:hypothetical protein
MVAIASAAEIEEWKRVSRAEFDEAATAPGP